MRAMVSFPNPFRRPTVPDSIDIDSATVPDGFRVFAFGDVHGRADLLRELQHLIGDDLSADPPDQAVIIGLGDYIDRGPDSRGTLDVLVSLQRNHETRFLKGNHEALFLSFLEDPARVGRVWLDMGGWETLMSYGIDCSPNVTSAGELAAIRADLAEMMPPEHLAILSNLPKSTAIGDYFFVHAGARPGVPLSESRERDALWIRDGFADRDAPFEKIVVHGHSPVTHPFVGKHRINLDTGAYATGKLTCLVLQGSERRFLEVTG